MLTKEQIREAFDKGRKDLERIKRCRKKPNGTLSLIRKLEQRIEVLEKEILELKNNEKIL